MESYCQVQEIKAATSLSRATILRKLKASKCPFEKRKVPGRGKPGHWYSMAGLPKDWQFRVMQLRANQAAKEMAAAKEEGQEKLPALCMGPAQTPEQLPSVFSDGVPKEKANRALLSHRLVKLYEDCLSLSDTSYGRKMSAQEEFVRRYNLGQNGSYSEIFNVLGPITRDMLERWKRQLRAAGDNAYALADSRGHHRSGVTIVSQEQMELLTAIMLNPNRPTVSEGIRRARQRWEELQIPSDQHDNTLRNAILRWKRNHYPLWVYHREGWKAFNEECLMHIDRDYSKIEVGDIAVADGHKLNIEILDPWTGKPRRMILVLFEDMKSSFPLGWCLSRTENVAAITFAYYRACLTLGKVPKVVYADNGKAFRKKVFNSLTDFRQSSFVSIFERAGSKTIFAWPYHAESKTIERLFGSMAEFERVCPSYTGTSIETKPARLKRNEREHRRTHQKLTGGRFPTMQEVDVALRAWFAEFVQRPQKGRLKGRSPLDVFNEGGGGTGPGFSQEALFDLQASLLPTDHRIVRRDGIRMPWSVKHYWHPSLFGKKDHQVEVRFDRLDPSYILVFDQNGRFLCEAKPRALVHPAAHILGTAEDQEELEGQITEKRRQGKSVIVRAKQFTDSHILPEQRRAQERLGFVSYDPTKLIPVPQEDKQSRQNAPEEPGITDAEWREIEEKDALLDELARDARRKFEEVLSRSDLAQRFDQAWQDYAKGGELTQEQLNIISIFPHSPEYKEYREHWEDRKLSYAGC